MLCLKSPISEVAGWPCDRAPRWAWLLASGWRLGPPRATPQPPFPVGPRATAGVAFPAFSLLLCPCPSPHTGPPGVAPSVPAFCCYLPRLQTCSRDTRIRACLLLLLRTQPPHGGAWDNLLKTAWLTAGTSQTVSEATSLGGATSSPWRTAPRRPQHREQRTGLLFKPPSWGVSQVGSPSGDNRDTPRRRGPGSW